MGMFDDTGISFPGYAADTTAALADQPSVFQSIGNVITKGIPLTALSVANSFANTGIEVANFFGADIAPFTAQKELSSMGWDDYESYYNSHQQGIEAAGLIAGSFIPGLAAVKAVKVMQVGRMGTIASRATNLFMAPTEDVISGALNTIKTGDAALYPSIYKDKYAAIALGFRDQAVQSLAFEMASVATMHASPLLDDASWQQLSTDAFYGVLLGGGIGGTIEGIATRSIFNKANIAADIGTKAFEQTKRLGLFHNSQYDGTSIAGDRTLLLLDSIYNIPESGGGILGIGKRSATIENAILDAKKDLQNLVSPGSEDLSNSLFDMLYKGRTEGGMSKEDMYDMLSRLSSIKRIGEPATTPTTDFFYVNKNAPGKTPVTSLSDVFTVAPNAAADISRRYQVNPYSTGVKIARFDNTFTTEAGVNMPLYNSAKEAFDAGNDIWVNNKMQVSVNPTAPNLTEVARSGESRILTTKQMIAFDKTGQVPADSKPIIGAPLVVNVKTGAIKNEAVPVPGDLGTVVVRPNGVSYGAREFSPQSLNSPLSAETPSIDASSRYLWAADRGIRRNDVIAGEDIPMLEAMYNEGTKTGDWNKYAQDLERKGVTFADGSDIPVSPNEMLNKIRGAKDDLIHDITTSNPKLSSEEIARRVNVPESYLESGFKAEKPTDYMVPTDSLKEVNHVQLEYNIGNVKSEITKTDPVTGAVTKEIVGSMDGNIIRGLIDTQYRMQLLQDVAKTAVVKAFGTNGENMIIGRYTSADANISGSGAGIISFANAAYGTLAQATERVGRLITNIIGQRVGDAMKILSPEAAKIRTDVTAAAELGFFNKVRRSTSENFTFLPQQFVDKYLPDVVNKDGVAVLSRSLVKDKRGNITNWNKDYLPEGFYPGLAKAGIVDDLTTAQRGLRSFYELSPAVSDFERAHLSLNDARIVRRNDLRTAQGLLGNLETGNLYAPPIDVSKYPNFALVIPKAGKAFADDSVGVVVGENARALEQKMAAVDRESFDVITKDMTKKYHDVLGDYEYSRNFNTGQANAELRRKGVFSDIFPDTRAETILRDYQDFHSRQETRLTRDYVELGNSQLFAELRAMGERFTAPETSTVNWWSNLFAKSAENPYRDYINTALGVRKEGWKLWSDAQEYAEAFASTAYRVARSSFTSFQKGVMNVNEASAMAERMGLGNPYGKAVDAYHTYYNVANQLPPTRALTEFVNTANMIQAATAIRLDTFQSLINIVSAPILTLSELSSARGLVTTALPDGSGRLVPATSKLIAAGIGDWFDRSVRDKWLPILKDMGIVREVTSDYFKSIEAMSLPGLKASQDVWKTKLEDMVNFGSKITGSQLTENFVRYTAAMMARRLYEAAGVEGTDLIDNMGTFVNRVHGNYVASQRPIAFQGPIGQAMSLFQTYQVNLMQQLFRYVENGEAKTLAIFAGLQGGLFGIQGLPGMQLINQHLIGNAASNPSHKDIYSTTINYAGKDLGDWLLYGAVSNITHTGLYSRGDINPRNISILPLNPLEFPAISGAISFISNLLDATEKMKNGAAIGATIMNGLEHNGMSRPLSGLGQLMQGFTTTSKGDLSSAIPRAGTDNSLGWNDLFNAANWGRLAGARPLDEAITMDAMYRKVLYQAKDTARIEAIGEAAKSYLRGNGNIPPEAMDNFAVKYAQSGGWMPRYGQEVMKWTQESNVSQANQVFRHLERPINQQMQMIMGGRPLPDYSNLPSTRAADTGLATSQTVVP